MARRHACRPPRLGDGVVDLRQREVRAGEGGVERDGLAQQRDGAHAVAG